MNTPKKPSLTVKTNLKAGEHCWNAFKDLMNDPKSRRKQDKFISCCQADKKCLN